MIIYAWIKNGFNISRGLYNFDIISSIFEEKKSQKRKGRVGKRVMVRWWRKRATTKKWGEGLKKGDWCGIMRDLQN